MMLKGKEKCLVLMYEAKYSTTKLYLNHLITIIIFIIWKICSFNADICALHLCLVVEKHNSVNLNIFQETLVKSVVPHVPLYINDCSTWSPSSGWFWDLKRPEQYCGTVCNHLALLDSYCQKEPWNTGWEAQVGA